MRRIANKINTAQPAGSVGVPPAQDAGKMPVQDAGKMPVQDAGKMPALPDRCIHNGGSHLLNDPSSIQPAFFRHDGIYGLYPLIPDLVWLQRLLREGVKTIQLRLKDIPRSQVRQQIRDALAVTQDFQDSPDVPVQLVINDYWEDAIVCGAEYVHLGQEDLAHADCSALQAAGICYGISTHSPEELQHALSLQPNYIAFGPIFPPTGKQVDWQPQGIERIAAWKQAIDVPLVAIGGITLATASQVLQAGADSIAVIGDILFHSDPAQQIRSWLRLFATRTLSQ